MPSPASGVLTEIVRAKATPSHRLARSRSSMSRRTQACRPPAAAPTEGRLSLSRHQLARADVIERDAASSVSRRAENSGRRGSGVLDAARQRAAAPFTRPRRGARPCARSSGALVVRSPRTHVEWAITKCGVDRQDRRLRAIEADGTIFGETRGDRRVTRDGVTISDEMWQSGRVRAPRRFEFLNATFLAYELVVHRRQLGVVSGRSDDGMCALVHAAAGLRLAHWRDEIPIWTSAFRSCNSRRRSHGRDVTVIGGAQ